MLGPEKKCSLVVRHKKSFLIRSAERTQASCHPTESKNNKLRHIQGAKFRDIYPMGKFTKKRRSWELSKSNRSRELKMVDVYLVSCVSCSKRKRCTINQSINHLFSNAGLQSGSHKADVDLQRTNEI